MMAVLKLQAKEVVQNGRGLNIIEINLKELVMSDECRESIDLWPLFWCVLCVCWFLTVHFNNKFAHDLKLQESINKANIERFKSDE
jgi:hypothetical protein